MVFSGSLRQLDAFIVFPTFAPPTPPPPFPPGRGGGGWPGEGTAPDRARGAGKSVPGAPTAWQPPAPSARLLRRGGPVPQRAECGSGKRAKCSFAPLRSLGLRPRSAELWLEWGGAARSPTG